MSLVPRKSRIDESNGTGGTYGKEASKNSELPFKSNNKSKSQRIVNRKPSNRLTNNIKREINSRDFNYKNETDQFTLDRINLKIVEELITNGDIKSSEIAAKLKIPLSTIQRRRSNLEKNSILKKNYTLDLKKLGLRISEISVATRNGESQNVMNVFYNKHKKNIVNMALRIGNPDTNISFRVAYSDSIELFSLLEEIKEMEMVSMVEWSEYITEKNNKEISFSDLV